MLYIVSPLSYIWKFKTLNNLHSFPPSFSLRQPPTCCLHLWESFDFGTLFRLHLYMRSHSIYLSLVDSFHLHNSLNACLCCCKCQDFLLFYGWKYFIVFLHTYIYTWILNREDIDISIFQFLHTFIGPGTLTLCADLGYCDPCCNEHGGVDMAFQSPRCRVSTTQGAFFHSSSWLFLPWLPWQTTTQSYIYIYIIHQSWELSRVILLRSYQHLPPEP